jgi:hypothetical protein
MTESAISPSHPAPALRRAAIALLGVWLVGCSTPGTTPRSVRLPAFAPQHLAKTDIDRFAEAHQQRIFVSLRRLAEKLYKRNPREWRKSGAPDMETAVARIFDTNHGWRLDELGQRRDIDALQIAFQADYNGDRVAAFIVGLSSMVQTAFGDKVEFYLLDDLNAQRIYNAARNVEIAAWKLASARDGNGQPLLLSNEIGEVTNLSFERDFGRIIGQLEVLSDVIEEKTERTVTRVVQNMATAVFLPVR